MPGPFEIRPLQVSDLQAVVALGLKTPEIQDFEGPALFFDSATLSDWLQSPHDFLRVAIAHQGPEPQLAGFLLASYNPHPRLGYLYDVVVDPCWQGQGAGQALLQAMLAYFREQQARELWCLVHEANPRMLRLLQQLGFQQGRCFWFMGLAT